MQRNSQIDGDDDDFLEIPPTTQILSRSKINKSQPTQTQKQKQKQKPLKPISVVSQQQLVEEEERASKNKKPKTEGKENDAAAANIDFTLGLESIHPTVFLASTTTATTTECSHSHFHEHFVVDATDSAIVPINKGYLRNSIESRLLNNSSNSRSHFASTTDKGGSSSNEEEEEEDVGALLRLCSAVQRQDDKNVEGTGSIRCPLCGADISSLDLQGREIHTNRCLDGREEKDLRPSHVSLSSLLTLLSL